MNTDKMRTDLTPEMLARERDLLISELRDIRQLSYEIQRRHSLMNTASVQLQMYEFRKALDDTILAINASWDRTNNI